MHYIFAEVRFFWRNQPNLRFFDVLTLLVKCANTFGKKC